jgi:hypothetical protein
VVSGELRASAALLPSRIKEEAGGASKLVWTVWARYSSSQPCQSHNDCAISEQAVSDQKAASCHASCLLSKFKAIITTSYRIRHIRALKHPSLWPWSVSYNLDDARYSSGIAKADGRIPLPCTVVAGIVQSVYRLHYGPAVVELGFDSREGQEYLSSWQRARPTVGHIQLLGHTGGDGESQWS